MKKLLLSLMLVFSMITINPIIDNPIVEIHASTIKLNKTKVSIKKGKTTTLKVSGTKKKVKWSSSNKKVASVNSKGKVTAKKNGTAYIYAKVSNKTLKCKITVKATKSTKKSSSYVYITQYGKKYHRIANCGRNKYVSKISLSKAKSQGYTPCKKCY